jgi:ABC-type amino acid transport substrate-binding protein
MNTKYTVTVVICLLLLAVVMVGGASAAGESAAAAVVIQPDATPGPVPTLAVPTPIPAAVPQTTAVQAVESALVRIRETGQVRVGVLYNAAPLSRLSERGDVVGYEADLARAIADDWAVAVEFVQVTRQNAEAMLLAGEVDLLLASMVHQRDPQSPLAYSYTYFASGQLFLVPADGPQQTITDLTGQRIGVVQGTASERALGYALSAGILSVQPELFLTLDQAVGALGTGAVDAVLSDRVHLLAVTTSVDNVRLLEEWLTPEPLAIAFRRSDHTLEYLVNRAIQRAYADGTFDEMRRAWFPSVNFSLEVPIWAGVDEDSRTLAALDTSLTYSETSLVDRIRAGETLNVAGLELRDGASLYNQRMEGFYRAVVDEMARRWGVQVTYMPNTAATAIDLVSSGQAALAVGIAPGWTGPYEVAYTAPLIQHGDRLMLPDNSQVEGFADLRGGRWVGVFASEPGAADRVNELAESVNSAVNIFTIINDEDAVYSMVVDSNADVVFGDSLRLLPLVEANPEQVRLTDRLYSQEYIGMAVPRLDPDFRALVDITLQEMAADGTFDAIWQAQLGFGEPLDFELWPGDREAFAGVTIR